MVLYSVASSQFVIIKLTVMIILMMIMKFLVHAFTVLALFIKACSNVKLVTLQKSNSESRFHIPCYQKDFSATIFIQICHPVRDGVFGHVIYLVIVRRSLNAGTNLLVRIAGTTILIL